MECANCNSYAAPMGCKVARIESGAPVAPFRARPTWSPLLQHTLHSHLQTKLHLEQHSCKVAQLDQGLLALRLLLHTAALDPAAALPVRRCCDGASCGLCSRCCRALLRADGGGADKALRRLKGFT